jgi:hypothetical protein
MNEWECYGLNLSEVNMGVEGTMVIVSGMKYMVEWGSVRRIRHRRLISRATLDEQAVYTDPQQAEYCNNRPGYPVVMVVDICFPEAADIDLEDMVVVA